MKNLFFLITAITIFCFSCSKDVLVDTSSNMLQDVNSKTTFDTEIAEGVSLVFFHASWCSICKEQRPVVETTSEKSAYSDVFFGEVEYEDNTAINSAYNVTGFPTILIFKDGIEQYRHNGAGHSESTLAEELDALL